MEDAKRHMVGLIKGLRRAERELSEAEEAGKAYLEMVKREVEEDLAGPRGEVERLRGEIQRMLVGEFGGEKFRAPGLGTCYLTRKRRTRISDEAALAAYIEGNLGEEYVDQIMPRKLSASAAKRFAEAELSESGELLPGVDVEETETLGFRAR